jgi:hypothetical protein
VRIEIEARLDIASGTRIALPIGWYLLIRAHKRQITGQRRLEDLTIADAFAAIFKDVGNDAALTHRRLRDADELHTAKMV